MKKVLFFLSFLLMSTGVWSAETLVYTLEPATGSNNNYANNCDITISGVTWNLTGNSTMIPWRIGGKSLSGVNRNLYSKTAITDNVSKIIITHGSASSITINSMSIIVSSTQNGGGTVTSTLTPSFVKNGDVVVTRPEGVNWSGKYYKITYNVTVTGTSNRFIEFVEAKFYKEDDAPCDSVTISLTPPTNGTASLNETEVCPGDEIEVYYTPDEGYTLDKILANGNIVTNPITITENTTIQVLFKEIPPEPTIDVARWDTNAVYINIDNFEGLTAEIEGKSGNNVADDLFFSKYFEADGDNKLIAIYNGTTEKKNLNNYQLIRSEWQNTSQSIRIHRTIELNGFGHNETGYIYPGEEIIILRYTNNDTSADTCSRKQENYDSWYIISAGTLDSEGNNIYSWLSFAGPMSIGLYDKTQEKFIDIIGASTNSNGTGNLVQIKSSNNNPCNNAINTEYNDGAGFSTLYGDNFKTDEIESNYFLSTNRCLLIRKNTVHSGDSAVKYNVYSTDLDCSSSISSAFVTLSSEWSGFQISNVKGEAAKKLTCEGLAYVGGFDYSKHYSSSVDLIEALQEDGTYKLEISQLDTLACNNVKIIAKDNSSTVEETFKVPIMVAENKTSSQILSKHGSSCPTCDLVVMHGATLTIDGALTNRNVKVYEGSSLNIQSDKTYTINSLALRRDNNSVSTLGLVGILNTNHLYFDLYIDYKDWYYVALPDTFTLSRLRFANGKEAIHRTDYWVKYYDGKHRAETQSGSWKTAPNDTTFYPGCGFIIGLADDLIKKELRFEFNTESALTNEKSPVNGYKAAGNLCAWGINSSVRPNHKGWNLVGNPYMNYYVAEIYAPIRAGELIKDETSGHWNGQWLVSDTTTSKSRYAVVPSKAPADQDAGGYKSVVIDEEFPLSPFTCFFVQMGGNNENPQTLKFNISQKRNNIVARRVIEEEDKELFLRVKVDDWKTGCFISNNFTDEYEPGDDLESRYPIYQTINGYKLLYSAINDSILESGVKITTPVGRLRLDPKVNIDEFEYIQVFYNENWYDLTIDELDVEGEFILYGKRKINNTATGLDNNYMDSYIKYMDKDHNVYFKYKNHVYTIDGKLKK